MGKRLEQLLAMLSSEPNDLFLHYALALEYISAGDQEKGIDQLKQIIQRNPDYLPAYHKLGDLFLSEAPIRQPLKCWRQASKKRTMAAKPNLRCKPCCKWQERKWNKGKIFRLLGFFNHHLQATKALMPTFAREQ